MTEPEGASLFDPQRQAELARSLERLDARPPLDQAEVFARAARTLAPPPAVVRVLDGDAEADLSPTRDD